MKKLVSSIFIAASALFLFPSFVPRADLLCSSGLQFNAVGPLKDSNGKKTAYGTAVELAQAGFCNTLKSFNALHFF